MLLPALGNQKNKTLVSICAAGDNAIAMLTLDPKKVIAIDLSAAQISCLKLRMAAYQTLTHQEFIELSGSRVSNRRGHLLDKVAATLDADNQAFWLARKDDVIAYGFGGVGKFERFFRIFHSKILPLVQSKKKITSVLQSKPYAEREAFLRNEWNHWRWRLMLKVFFSNFVMGKLGRDPAFFAHVEGSLSDHVAGRLKHAIVDLDASENPYLHWVLRGTHNDALPLPWQKEHFDTIRQRLDRLDICQGSLEAFVASGEKADGFNLSDIFEYVSEDIFNDVYAAIISAANAQARLVYWNMMVPRRRPESLANHIETLIEAEAIGKANDKAFFYSDFIVEAVK